jgi:5-methylcytosine-specific restriction enzyme A
MAENTTEIAEKLSARTLPVLLEDWKNAQDRVRQEASEPGKVMMENTNKKRRMYDSARWRRCRARHLSEHPFCVICDRQGITTAASVVDHIKEHKGDHDLFWDAGNWQSLCPSCHSGIKRMQENRGYSPAADVDGMPLDDQHPWSKGRS